MAGDPGASIFAAFCPATTGGPAGATTVCDDGFSIARHLESFDVRTSTVHSAGVLSVCHSSTRLSEAESLGESPSCRYGFSRNGVPDGIVPLSRSATDSSEAGKNLNLRIAGHYLASGFQTCDSPPIYSDNNGNTG